MKKCVIAVPCYNEASRLNRTEFRKFLTQSQDVCILFVNDGSRDETLAVLREMQAEMPDSIAILDKQRNQGKGEAVRDGMLHALQSGNSSYVGFWDADLATPLSAIHDFLELMESRPDIEIILGSRVKLLGRQIERRAVRHYMGRVFATFASLALGLPVYDTQCGAKLFRATPLLRDTLRDPFCSRWIFDVELLARFIVLSPGISERMYEFPLYAWRDVPGSKIEAADWLRAAKELWVIWKRYMRGRKAGSWAVRPAKASEKNG